MANENQSQQNIQETAGSLSSAQATAQAAATAAAQGLAVRQYQATNKEFKESINLLNKINKLIDDSTSKTASFEKSTINIKRIQQEQERVLRKQNNLQAELSRLSDVDTNKASEYITKVQQRKQEEEKILRAKSLGLNVSNSTLVTLEQEITDIEQLLTAEQLKAVAIQQSNEGLKERVTLLEEEEAKERDIQKQLGPIGAGLKLLNKYLLFGKDMYGKMVEEAREGETVTKKWVAGVAILSAAVYGAYQGMKKFADIAKSGLDSLTGTGGPIASFVSPFTNLIKQIPFIGGLIGGLVDAFANIIDFATGATSKIQEFARNLGISFSQAKSINTQFEQIARNSGLAFVTVEKLTNSQLELSQALGVNNILSKEILQDNIQLQEQVGLELDARKQLAQVAIISGTRQTQIFKTITGQVEAVRRSVGVNLRVQDIISKISQLSGVVGLTFAKYPEKLTKSLAITKALGIDFQKLDSIASGLLDFESSLAAEFEAQLITGKDINLGKARQLALDNDLTGLAVELNKQLGSSEEFINMNRIAQEAHSKAIGMSRDEIADMLRQQEFFAAAGATDLKTFKEKVAQMEKAGTLQKDFVSKLSEEQAQYFLSSTATENIASFMEKIRQSFASLLSSEQFKSFLDVFLNKLSDPNFLTDVINKITGFVSIMIKAIAGIVDVADVVGNVFSLGKLDIDNSIPDTIRSYANSLGSVSIGGAVASSQTSAANASAVGTGTSAPATVAGSPQAINLTVQTVIDDHGRKAEQRMQRNPRADIKTGNIQ
jgi:hypothetical protein